MYRATHNIHEYCMYHLAYSLYTCYCARMHLQCASPSLSYLVNSCTECNCISSTASVSVHSILMWTSYKSHIVLNRDDLLLDCMTARTYPCYLLRQFFFYQNLRRCCRNCACQMSSGTFWSYRNVNGLPIDSASVTLPCANTATMRYFFRGV
jgi:hypothetical protein